MMPHPLIEKYVAGNFEKVMAFLPQEVRWTLQLQALAFLKIPVLAFISPRVVAMTDERCEIKIPLARRNKNHLGSMYFAVQAAGADCACGLAALKLIDESGKKINLVFKDFQAEFLKRPDGETHFICDEVKSIRELVAKAAASGERENLQVNLRATVPSKYGDEPVALFKLTLSLKAR
jgi:acyl-coenzyme A thioesterase PaaI-like protein